MIAVAKILFRLTIAYSVLIILYRQQQPHTFANASPPSAELSFCLKQPTTSHTLQTFWHDANNNDCQLEAKQLIDLFKRLQQKLVADQDRCSLLFVHQIRKKLIAVVGQQLEEALITSTLRDNSELELLLEEIARFDKRILEALWQRTLAEIYLFVNQEELIEKIMQQRSEESQVLALRMLSRENSLHIEENPRLKPLLAFAISKLLNSKSIRGDLKEELNRFKEQLPQELILLYSQLWRQSSIGLLNFGHWEFLYAPRENGPDNSRRLPLTWSKNKNSTDSDGHFLVEFNGSGLIAIASRYGSSFKYLYADVENQAPFFWIGPGNKINLQWWQVVWPHAKANLGEGQRPIALQSKETGDFLCATSGYDENRRYVVLMQDGAGRSDCLWLVREFV
uniref:Uncharacterized protein n=1 Tax=Musca domestica TaxID=7370 RepID=A0A1I8NJY0_MUSDO